MGLTSTVLHIVKFNIYLTFTLQLGINWNLEEMQHYKDAFIFLFIPE